MRTSSLIIAGYNREKFSAEIINRGSKISKSINIPRSQEGCLMTQLNESILLIRGRFERKCFQLIKGQEWSWKYHSTLNQNRSGASLVSTNKTKFVFGGRGIYDSTYEYLPKHCRTWILGKTKIPNGFRDGGAIAVKSEQEIWLIGGWNNEKRILCFNVNDHTFEELPLKLNIGRTNLKCAFIPGTGKVMIAGGYSEKFLNSSEVLDPEDGSITLTSPMKSKRADYGIGVVTINGEDKLALAGGLNIGGNFLKSVEIYDEKTQKWKRTNIKLNTEKSGCGFMSIKLGLIYEMLTSKAI